MMNEFSWLKRQEGFEDKRIKQKLHWNLLALAVCIALLGSSKFEN